jgi:hypothetical protein
VRTSAFIWLQKLEPGFYRCSRPKQDLLCQVIAGLLWLSLDLPDDPTKEELDALAEQLVAGIAAGSDEITVVAELIRFQSKCFCKPPNISSITTLARRMISTVNGCNAVYCSKPQV